MWLLDPWLDTTDERKPVDEATWFTLSQPVLLRSQVLRLHELANRRRRRSSSAPVQSEDEDAIAAFQDRLIAQHGQENVRFTGGKKQWRVSGESMPDITERVIAVTECSYGSTFVGSGINPYPMLSGYAHASIETLFASAPDSAPIPITSLLEASPEELHTLVTLGLRLFAVTYELAAKSLGSRIGDVSILGTAFRVVHPST